MDLKSLQKEKMFPNCKNTEQSTSGHLLKGTPRCTFKVGASERHDLQMGKVKGKGSFGDWECEAARKTSEN